jgi:serine phosphatase RsbU (regulator of sigma subunit)/ligand-binding sensor domain-containing protein
MNKNAVLALRSIIQVCLVLITAEVCSQSYSFRNYGSEYGIPNGFVYTINQADNGFLWVGTGNGIARFDGYQFYPVLFPDSVSRNPGASFRDNSGIIWFGCSDGTLFRTSGNKLEKIPLPNEISISQIVGGDDGSIYIIPQGGAIFKIDPASGRVISSMPLAAEYTVFSALYANERLLLGTQGSVLVCTVQNDSVLIKKTVEEFEYDGISAIACAGGEDSYVVGTQYTGIFRMRLTGDSAYVVRFDNPGWSDLNVKSITHDEDGKIWVSSHGTGVTGLSVTPDGQAVATNSYNVSTGLASGDVNILFRDMEGNYWFGLFGEGVSMLTSNAFSFFTPGDRPDRNNIRFTGYLDGKYVLGTPSGFHFLDPASGKSISFTDLLSKTGGAQILSYCIDDRMNLYIGTDANGLFMRSKSGVVSQVYRSGDSGSDKINDIRINEQNIWLGTVYGVVLLDRSGRLKKTFRNNDGLPHNLITSILLDGSRAYLGSEMDRLYAIDENMEIDPGTCIMTGSTKNSIRGLTIDSDGVLWAATYGNGVFGCYGDSVISINRSSGLYSNYCYSIFADSRNNVWIGHAKGFSRLDDGSASMKVFGPEYTKGGICNPGAFYEAPDGRILMGTTEGVVVFNSMDDNTKKIPPVNNIVSVIINDEETEYKPVINLPYGRYKVVIRYTGINFSDPGNVYYRTIMENFDLEEGQLSASREATYNLIDGRYRFRVQSVDENGLEATEPAFLEIQIAPPIYKKWWFIILMVALVAGIVSFIFWQREKAQKKIRLYLEDELRKRTATIVKQKNEIEIQNIEITDSINYAKRIQTSILPDVHKLRESFVDAFIIFYPRDIVSGDFYWFDKIGDDKFLVVCADSTGHGVPGAFMSMIGSTLLQDIIARKGITQPSTILSLLDKQIFSTLNQNLELGVSNDGMDMVVCEFNLRTRHVRFASAMRPILLIHGGETFYIKGNRASVGGESLTEKYFDDQEYYLNEGDSLYLFSDGFPDQFGGSDGKKMKIARLKKTIEDMAGKPMKEQEQVLSQYFSEWRGSYDQVDDVLLMGIKV